MKYLLKSIFILIGLIWALPLRAAETTACIKAPSCEELGYTRTIAKCKGVNYLHCPFDSAKVYCILPMKTGDILYSDFTYDSDVIAGKTPIGVIVDPSRRLAAALEYSSGKLAMGTGSTDIFGYSSESSALANFTGASNTEELLSAFSGSPSNAPAANYCHTYSTAGTSAGEWFLPSLGQLDLLTSNIRTINSTLQKLGKRTYPTRTSGLGSSSRSLHLWSSSSYSASGEATSSAAYLQYLNRRKYDVRSYSYTYTANVVPFLQF